MREDSPAGPSTPGDRETRRRRKRRQGRRRLLALVFVVVAAAVAAVLAVRDGDGGEPAAGAAGTGSGATTAPASPAPPPPVWAATPVRPARVWIGGDSLAGELDWGLTPFLDEAGAFKCAAFYKGSAGICRYDYFDWGREMRSVMAKGRPDAVVFMIGANDTQSVWTADGWIHYGTARWKAAYGRRVGKLMDIMLEGGARRVYWVGMPIMAERWRDSRMRVIDKLFATEADARPGVTYIDIRALFADADGRYVARWRGWDGVHFETAGWRRLGKRVYRHVGADWLPATATPTASPSASAAASAASPD